MRPQTTFVLLALAGCRADPGRPDYSGLSEVFERANETRDNDVLPGPDPYVAGEDRLGLGIFYEGSASEVVPIDGTASAYYIFLANNQLTFVQTSAADRVEGRQSDLFTLAGAPWWGGGVVWDPVRDLRPWTVLSVSLKSNDLEDVNVTVGSTVEVALPASSYGYAGDGQWHNLTIPLSDFEAGGVDLSAIRLVFALGGVGGSGARLLVDNVYME